MSKQTTVTIDQDTAQKLERLSKAHGLSKKDFLSVSLAYFEKYGINPAEHETPTAEMERIRKRLDQFFAFLKKQEQDKINPMFEAITTTEARIKKDLDTVAKVSTLQQLTNKLGEVFGGIQQGTKSERERAAQRDDETRKALLLMAQVIEDGKDRQGLTAKIRGLFK